MSPRRRLCAFAIAAAALMPALQFAHAEETSPANASALSHSNRARAYYEQGAYREAISEFEAAHALDPNAKDLVYNLGFVHEKLADIDDALTWFRLYSTMKLTPTERVKAEAAIKRLEGAKKELDAKQGDASTDAAPAPPPPPPPPQPVETPSSNGRIDALTIGGAALTVAGLAVGVVMGVKAEADKPPANYVTGKNGSYNDMLNAIHQAHQEAIVADVGFGAAIVAAAVTSYLYFGRPSGTSTPSTGSTGSTSVSAAPMTGGGAFFVQGSF